MNPFGKKIALLVSIFCLFVFLACTQSISTDRQRVSGTFSGRNLEGEPVTLTLDQVGYGFRGNGSINGNPVVVSGVQIWEAIGALTRADGTTSLVRITLAPNGDTLTIQALGQTDIDLLRGGTPVSETAGPFTGTYRPAPPDNGLARVTIVQTGSLISGVAEIFDQVAAISGKVTEPNKALGTVTYADESRAMFHAELSVDASTITIKGIGDPIVFERF